MARRPGDVPASGEGCGQQPRLRAMLSAAVGQLCPAPLLTARCHQQKPGLIKAEAKKKSSRGHNRALMHAVHRCFPVRCVHPRWGCPSAEQGCVTAGDGKGPGPGLWAAFGSVATGLAPFGFPLAPPGQTEAEALGPGRLGKWCVNNSPM